MAEIELIRNKAHKNEGLQGCQHFDKWHSRQKSILKFKYAKDRLRVDPKPMRQSFGKDTSALICSASARVCSGSRCWTTFGKLDLGDRPYTQN